MNIFYLDDDLETNAHYHIDKHIVKMPLETAQILTTTVWIDKFLGFIPRALTKIELAVINTEKSQQPVIDERTFTRYLPTHPNHPCCIWARSSMANYEWLYGYLVSLSDEYTYRYGKQHKAMDEGRRLPIPEKLVGADLLKRPLCMPDDYKSDSVIDSYRMYYMMDKSGFASWKGRDIPPWWDKYLIEELKCA